jgi:CRP/FNR family transcriptional regulator, cyclic AMP receptor protein
MGDDALLHRFGREFPRGTVLFKEGDPGREMFVVQSGKVTISKQAGAVEKVLSTLGQGEFFGEMSILTAQARTATAVVTEDARILVIDSRTFEAMVRGNGEIALRLIKKLAERLAAADDQISNLLFRDVSSRVVHWLATQAERAARGPGPVRLPVPSEALPGLVGVEPAEVEEALAKLLRARIIELDGDGVTVREVAKLRHFLEFLQMKARFGEAS